MAEHEQYAMLRDLVAEGDEHVEVPAVLIRELLAERDRSRMVVHEACRELDVIGEHSGWGSIGIVVEQLMDEFQLDALGPIEEDVELEPIEPVALRIACSDCNGKPGAVCGACHGRGWVLNPKIVGKR